MKSPHEKVLELVASGKISSADGSQLLTALKPERSRIEMWLIDPFELITLRWVWTLAVVVFIGSVALTPFQIRFDGAVDLHRVEDPVSWIAALSDQLVAWPLTALCFWLAARLTQRRPNFTEMFALVGAARLPLLLAACLLLAVRDLAGIDKDSPMAILLTAPLPLVAWTFLTLLSAFRACSGARGRSLAATFFIALVSAELLSNIVLRVAL